MVPDPVCSNCAFEFASSLTACPKCGTSRADSTENAPGLKLKHAVWSPTGPPSRPLDFQGTEGLEETRIGSHSAATGGHYAWARVLFRVVALLCLIGLGYWKRDDIQELYTRLRSKDVPSQPERPPSPDSTQADQRLRTVEFRCRLCGGTGRLSVSGQGDSTCRCPVCFGVGHRAARLAVGDCECPHCYGMGRVVAGDRSARSNSRLVSERCGFCNGSGVMHE